MRDFAPSPESRIRIDWANLNNALFWIIYADPDLRARYERADSAQAQEICSEQFDVLAHNVSEFVDRFITMEP